MVERICASPPATDRLLPRIFFSSRHLTHPLASEQRNVFDTVIGPKSDPDAIDRLLDVLGGLGLEGTLYVGYPMVLLGDQPHAVDALLTCRQHGVTVFNVRRNAIQMPPAQLASEAQNLRQAVSLALARSRKLTSGGRLIVEVRVVTLDPHAAAAPLPPQLHPRFKPHYNQAFLASHCAARTLRMRSATDRNPLVGQ